MVRDARNQQLRNTVTTTYSVTPAVRHDAYHATADDAAATSSRLAVRTVRVIIGEKFLDGGGEIRKGFRYVTIFGFASAQRFSFLIIFSFFLCWVVR